MMRPTVARFVVVTCALPACAIARVATAQDVERAAATPATRPALAPATTTHADELSEPTRISLKVENVDAMDAIGQLAKAAGLRLIDVPDDVVQTMKPHRVSGSFDREPLLSALKELCRQAEVEPVFPRRADGQPSLSLRTPKQFVFDAPPRSVPTGKPWTRCPSVFSGPVIFALRSATTQSNVQLQPDPQQPAPRPGAAMGPSISYSITMLPEPKLDVIATTVFPQILEVTDETGAAIPMRDRNPSDLQDARNEQIGMTVSIRLPREDVRRITLLRGAMRVRTAVRRESMSIPVDVDQPEAVPPKDVTVGGVHLRVPRVVRRGDTFELRYTVVRDGTRTDNWDKLLSSMSWRGPELVDGDGLALYQTGNRDERQANQDRTFIRWLNRGENGRPARGAPKAVVWSVPLETEEIEIPFEFHELPVPR